MKKDKETYTKEELEEIAELVNKNKEITKRYTMTNAELGEKIFELQNRIEALEKNKTVYIQVPNSLPIYSNPRQQCTCHLTLPCPVHGSGSGLYPQTTC